MRTVVVGASNSLVRGGVVQGLIDGGLDVIANGSLGHSQATILPFRLSDSQYGRIDFDHLVVEIATNEQIALRSSLANFGTIRSILNWTLRWCAERRISVTFVTMPESASYSRGGDLRSFEMNRFLNNYAAKNHVQIFDGYEWLEAWIKAHDATIEQSFETPAHIQPELAHAFGVYMAAAINPAPLTMSRQQHSTPDYEYVSLPEHDGWSESLTIERSTSLGSAQLLCLTPDRGFELDLKPGAIVGTVHNAAGSSAILQIAGLDTREKRMDAHPGEKLILTAWGMRTPALVQGSTTLTALPVEYRPGLEHNHATIWRPLSRRAQGVPTVELAGLVLAIDPPSGKPAPWRKWLR